MDEEKNERSLQVLIPPDSQKLDFRVMFPQKFDILLREKSLNFFGYNS
jgi:hypothetical protein